MAKRDAVETGEVADIVRPFGVPARPQRQAPAATFGGKPSTPPPIQRPSVWDPFLAEVAKYTAEQPGEWLPWHFGTEKEARTAQGAVSGRLKGTGDYHYKSKVRDKTLYVRRVAGPAPKRERGEGA